MIFRRIAQFVSALLGASSLASPCTTWADPKISDADLARYVFVPVFDILDCTNRGYIDTGEIDEHFGLLFNPVSAGVTRIVGRDTIVRSDDPEEAALQADLFDKLDANDDERVSMMEFRNGMRTLLSERDTDGDAEITLEELTAGEATTIEDSAAE